MDQPQVTKASAFLNNFINAGSTPFKFKMMYVGIVLGVLLLTMALILDLIVTRKTITAGNIFHALSINPVHWIVLTSPVFLGSFFYVMASLISERELHIEHAAQRDKKQFKLLEEFITGLEAGKYQIEMSSEFDNKQVLQKLDQFKNQLALDKQSEERRGWESQGLATFADLLRQSQDYQVLAEAVVRFLVKHVDCNQGSVFILNDTNRENLMLDLAACYAFDKKKFVTKSISIGEGLVGQCFLERDTVILHDVPKDYIRITSGLGYATPGFVAIVPLKTGDQTYGVLEVASFKLLEKYQVAFLEKACQAFASVVHANKTNANVKVLLEASQQHTEELRAQEEEMRQNMEELHAMQEQLSRQLEESTFTKKQLEAREFVLSKTTILSEADLHGTIMYVNEKFCEVSQYSREELVGRGHNIVRHPEMPKELFALMWSTIKKGNTFRGIVKNRKKDGSHYWVDATIVPIVEKNVIVKYIGARYHITDDVVAEQKYHEQMRKLGIREELLLVWE